jgi:UPF0716 protein FxsA
MKLLIPLITIPAIEVGLFFLSSKGLGILPTILLIIATGIIGAYLAKKQGLSVLKQVQERVARGEVPGQEVLDGLCVLIGAIFLLTPGFLSDLIGFILLIPFTRKMVRPLLFKLVQRMVKKKKAVVIYR